MKKKLQHPTERVLIFIIVAIIALVAAILWAFGQKIDVLWDQQQTQTAKSVPAEFGAMVQSAQEALYNPGAVDAPGKQVYFPGIKISVPLTNKSETFVYTNDLEQSTPTEFNLSARSIVNNYLSNFEDIKCIAKPAGVSVDKPSSSWKDSDKAGTVSLADGRTLYLYKTTAKGCQNVYAYVSPEDIISSLKQAKSY